MTLPDRDGAGNFTPSMGYLNANYGGDAPPPSRMNTSRMPGSDFSPFSPPPTPTWDSAPSPLIPGGAEPLLAQPSRSPGNASVNKTAPSQSGGTEGAPEILSDETPDNDWIPGAEYAAKGHHEFPQALYEGMKPEVRKILEAEHTGKFLVRSIDGRFHEYDAFHRQYSAAVGQILKDFMDANNISKQPGLLTPDHARELLRLVAESQDPRILTYRNFIRLFRLFPWLRSGGRE